MDSFVLTLELASPHQQHFEALRQQHFPAHLNRVPAHITLFHSLPASSARSIDHTLQHASLATIPFPVEVTGLRHLGKGVAYTLRSPALLTLHAALSDEFREDLSAQDRQRYSPHIVVQNKVTPEQSRLLHQQLSLDFEPFPVQGTGLLLWHYLNGPWQLAQTYRFPKERALSPTH